MEGAWERERGVGNELAEEENERKGREGRMGQWNINWQGWRVKGGEWGINWQGRTVKGG